MLFRVSPLLRWQCHSRRAFAHCSFRNFVTATPKPTKEEPSPLAKHLRDSIKLIGPITVAHYMRQVLLNPLSGYYMYGEVFGREGDFITSPEISQMFGELAGIWYLTEWLRLGKPAKTQIIELGPGKGTLMSDMLRALSRFPYFYETITGVHLVEASPSLRKVQRAMLTGSSGHDNAEENVEYAERTDGIRIMWHDGIELVPDSFSFLMAHEFFDALAVHAFQKTEEGWRELLVDIDDTDETKYNFRLVVSPSSTTASKAYIEDNERFSHYKVGDRVELSPDSWRLGNQMAQMVDKNGGAGLVIDYGQDYTQGDTLRAIRRHKIVHPMSNPGSADLSADVDFSSLKEAMKHSTGVTVHGPITQSKFLQSLGIQTRLQMLLTHAKTNATRETIISSFQRLLDPTMMGQIYKVLAFTKEIDPKGNPPVGFEKSDKGVAN